jgi:hypothetical protein
MLVQTDVTARVELENKLADLTDAQLSMLEQLFPRHIIEYMLARVPNKGDRNLRDLANMHEQVWVWVWECRCGCGYGCGCGCGCEFRCGCVGVGVGAN